MICYTRSFHSFKLLFLLVAVSHSGFQDSVARGIVICFTKSVGTLAMLCCILLFYTTAQDPAHRTNIALGNLEAAIAQLGKRQSEDLKVSGSNPGLGIYLLSACAVRRERRGQSLERATSLNVFVRLTPARPANLHRR